MRYVLLKLLARLTKDVFSSPNCVWRGGKGQVGGILKLRMAWALISGSLALSVMGDITSLNTYDIRVTKHMGIPIKSDKSGQYGG